ncbi:hypothetical protein ACGFXC_33485 [Streptomyces sp. NPDC048507]
MPPDCRQRVPAALRVGTAPPPRIETIAHERRDVFVVEYHG